MNLESYAIQTRVKERNIFSNECDVLNDSLKCVQIGCYLCKEMAITLASYHFDYNAIVVTVYSRVTVTGTKSFI